LQVGLGPDARVYAIDDVAGTVTPKPGAAVFEPPAWPNDPRAAWGPLTPPDDVDPFPGPVPLPDRAPIVKAPPGQWPTANAWSWDGRWTPDQSALPAACLYDELYFDGHVQPDGWPTAVLPPGDWDWDDAAHDYANWDNFDTNLGHFEALVDPAGAPFGWRFVGNDPVAVDFSGPALYFEGSCGAEILDLGPAGSIASFGEGSLAGGPDVLLTNASHSLDYRTGSDLAAPAPGAPPAGLHADGPPTSDEADNDLVVAGGAADPTGGFDVLTTTLHAGPGSDWIFARDVSRSAFDLGNGANGRTDTADPADGDDLLVLGGNAHDFRVMGGYGHDTVVWYVDEEVQTTLWLGPNLFGGGADGDALWTDPGLDRLVLVVPPETPVVHQTPTPAGSLLIKDTNGQLWLDTPVQGDPFARYCIECGVGPDGRKTVILEYYKADGSVLTGYFYVTAFEELQLGLGPDARVFRIDDVHGDLLLLPDATPFEPPPWPDDLGAIWIVAP